MANTVEDTQKRQKSILRIMALSCFMLVGGFIAVFFSTNNIEVSFNALTSEEKFPAKAFVNKREGRLIAKVEGKIPTTSVSTGTGLSATIDFDTENQNVNLSVRDKNNQPASRITVIGSISRVGERDNVQQFRMREVESGEFRSASLNLADGGWVLMVSAYDLFTLSKEKLLFHTERPIFLGENLE